MTWKTDPLPPEFIALVLELWNVDKRTSPEIASTLGITRNAVLGILFRHGGEKRRKTKAAERIQMPSPKLMAIAQAKKDKLLQALRIYAEKGASLPTHEVLGQMLGLHFTRVSLYIHQMRDAGLLRYERKGNTTWVMFPDGASTKPRDIYDTIRKGSDDTPARRDEAAIRWVDDTVRRPLGTRKPGRREAAD